MKRLHHAVLALCSASLLSLSPLAWSKGDVETMADAKKSVERAVQVRTQKETAERREKVVQDAVDALANTKLALKALEEDRTEDALDSLALATGKLELLVARDSGLALAPTDVVVRTHDIFGSVQAVRDAIREAKRTLSDGEVQTARHILDGMASEVVISVTSLPLSTYPQAIKALTPLIDAGKSKEALLHLQAALNTLIVTDHRIPLPVVRAEAMLGIAEALAEKEDRSDDDKAVLSKSLSAIREQVQIAEILGYGTSDDIRFIYRQLALVEERIDGGANGKFFSSLRDTFAKLWQG